MEDFSGQYLGHYYLQKRIGGGGYADVYKAMDIFLHRRVAVKVLKMRVDPDDLQDILESASEARTVAHLKHPHIVAVIEFNIHGDIPYIVMEYAKNGSLRGIHPRGERLEWETIMHYVQQITEALTFIHSHSIIHLDIKPDNLLLGDNNDVLVGDLGTVAFIQQTGPQHAQKCIGTPGYMPPERFTDYAPTAASDIYSLAVVVFEWFTGEAFFSGSIAEVIRQQRSLTFTAKRMAAFGISAAIQRVLLKALAKNPRDRYQSAVEFYTALKRATLKPDHRTVRYQQTSRWEKMAFIFLGTLFAFPLPGIGLYQLHVKPVTDVQVSLACLLLLPMLIALIFRNWVAAGFAFAIPIVAALIGLLLHSWLAFWITLPISLVLSALIGILHR